MSNLESLFDFDQVSLDSVSTNATADNLPGAGRTLGLLYSHAGRHLEVLLGGIAERMGRGSRATSLRIQKNSEIVTLASVLLLPQAAVKAKKKKIEKDCKRMLKYVRSNAASTAGEALDHIVDLSLDDHIRSFLKVEGAVHLIEMAHSSFMVHDNFDALLSRSRKALVSISDDVLMQAIKNLDYSGREEYIYQYLIARAYLRDPDRSFIVVRCLARQFYRTDFSVVLLLKTELKDVIVVAIDTSPEWDYIDQYIYNSLVVEQRSPYTGFLLEHVASALEIVFRHVDKLPLTVGSEAFQWFMEDRVLMQNGVTDFVGLNHAVWTVGLLRSFASQNTTVGMDFSCIDYSHVRVLYPHPILHPFFTRISSTPDRVFYQIFYERLHYDLRRSNNFSVIRPKTLERQSQELARSIDSEDRLLLNRVRHYIVSLLDMDKYCRAAILQALSTTRYGKTPEFARLYEKIQERNFAHKHIGSYIILTRYCDAGGSLLHLCDYPCPEGHPSEEMDYLNLPSAAVLELHIERGKAFFSAGYDPIIAGRTACGKLAYIAEAHFGLYDRCYCAVTEGMKPENLRFTMQGQRLKVPESFVVYVLRYEPFEYARKEWDEYGAEGLDPTGPFSWRTLIVKKQAMDRYKIGYFGPKQEPLTEVGQADSEEDASDEEDWKTAEE